MKNTFKISALAILVASLTACGASKAIKDAVNEAKDTTKEVTKPLQKKPEAAKPTTPAKPVEQKKPETAKPAEPAKPAQPAKPAEPLKEVSIDSQGKKWRVVGINGGYKGDSNAQNSASFATSYSVLSEEHADKGSACHLLVCKGDVLENKATANLLTRLELDALAQKDGKPLLGTYSGSVKKDGLSGKVIDAHFDKNGKLISSEKSPTQINYLFTNQPYSSYGAVFTNQNDIRLFYVTQNAGEKGRNGFYEHEVYKKHLDKGVETKFLVWNDNVKGHATYKGDVIATVTTIEPNLFDYKHHTPKVDGTVTLNAHFGKTWDDTYVSGELNSKTVGKFLLPKEKLNQDLSVKDSRLETTSSKFEQQNHYGFGRFDVQFGGKDLSEAVGSVRLHNYYTPKYSKERFKDGDVLRYNAVFGATKQPK